MRIANSLAFILATCLPCTTAFAEQQKAPKSIQTTTEEWKLRAEQGDPVAQSVLGDRYYMGKGVPQNDNQAASWYRKAAEQGDANAQISLGFLYKRGQGVPQDYTQAVYWYRKAAEQGYCEAQFNLGILYEYGNGVPQSSIIAYALTNLAASTEQGNASSELRESIAKIMTSDQVNAGQALTRKLMIKGRFLTELDIASNAAKRSAKQ